MKTGGENNSCVTIKRKLLCLCRNTKDCKHYTFAFKIYDAGVTFANLLHIFFDSYSANTQNINVTTLKINIIIKNTLF